MNFRTRIAADLADAIRERHVRSLHDQLHEATALLIESRGRSDAYRARLERTRANLRAQVTAAVKAQTRPPQPSLGGPVSMPELAARALAKAATT